MQFLWSAVHGWCFLYFLRLCLYISFVFTSFFLSFNLQVKIRIYPDWMTPGVSWQGSTRTDKWMDGHLAETVLQAEQMNEATSQWVASSGMWQTFKVNFEKEIRSKADHLQLQHLKAYQQDDKVSLSRYCFCFILFHARDTTNFSYNLHKFVGVSNSWVSVLLAFLFSISCH